MDQEINVKQTLDDLNNQLNQFINNINRLPNDYINELSSDFSRIIEEPNFQTALLLVVDNNEINKSLTEFIDKNSLLDSLTKRNDVNNTSLTAFCSQYDVINKYNLSDTPIHSLLDKRINSFTESKSFSEISLITGISQSDFIKLVKLGDTESIQRFSDVKANHETSSIIHMNIGLLNGMNKEIDTTPINSHEIQEINQP